MHTACLRAAQVISILHHHLSNHHTTGAYVPTDFFETAAMLITLVLCGKYLVSRRAAWRKRLVGHRALSLAQKPGRPALKLGHLLVFCFSVAQQRVT